LRIIAWLRIAMEKKVRRGLRRLEVAAWLAVLAVAGVIAAPGSAVADDPAFISFGAGFFDLLDDENSDSAADFRLELRSGYKALGFLKPWAGIEGTSDGALFTTGGMLVDLYFGRRFVLTPSFGIGIYAPGDGKDLGSDLEFRSQVEFGYRLNNRARISAAFSHTSNSGITKKNPGAEVIALYYHLPVGALFGE